MHRDVHGRMNNCRFEPRPVRIGGWLLGLSLLTGCGDASLPRQPVATRGNSPPSLLQILGDEQAVVALAAISGTESSSGVATSEDVELVGYPVVRAAKPPAQFMAAQTKDKDARSALPDAEPTEPSRTAVAAAGSPSTDAASESNDHAAAAAGKSSSPPTITIKLKDSTPPADSKPGSRGVVRAAPPPALKPASPQTCDEKATANAGEPSNMPLQPPRPTMTAVTIVPAPTPARPGAAPAPAAKPAETTKPAPSSKPMVPPNHATAVVRAARRAPDAARAKTIVAPPAPPTGEPASTRATEVPNDSVALVTPKEPDVRTNAAKAGPSSDEAVELIIRTVEPAGSFVTSRRPGTQPVVRVAKAPHVALPADAAAPVLGKKAMPAVAAAPKTNTQPVFKAPRLPQISPTELTDSPRFAPQDSIKPGAPVAGAVSQRETVNLDIAKLLQAPPPVVAGRPIDPAAPGAIGPQPETSLLLAATRQETSRQQTSQADVPTVTPPTAAKIVVDKAAVATLGAQPSARPVQPLVVQGEAIKAPIAAESAAKDAKTPLVAAAQPTLPAAPIAVPPVVASPPAISQSPVASQPPAIATSPYNSTLPKIFVGRPTPMASIATAAGSADQTRHDDAVGVAGETGVATRSIELDDRDNPAARGMASMDPAKPREKSALKLRPTAELVSKAPRADTPASRTVTQSRPAIKQVPTVVDKSSLGDAAAPPTGSIASNASTFDRPALPMRRQAARPSRNVAMQSRDAAAGPAGPVMPEMQPGPTSVARLRPETLPDDRTAAAPVVVPAAGRNAPTLLPPATLPRSPQMNVVALEAARHVRTGFGLAERGAFFAARSEFVQSLRLLSQALDVQHGTSRHSQALAAGMRALDEAEDFVPRGSRLEADLDLPMLIAGHRTPVLKEANVKELSPLVAQQRYYSYAQEQLGIAAAGEPAGSMALHGLGKIHSVIAAQPAPAIFAAEPKALVFQQAALLTDSRNYLAANELAVLLARNGYLQSARTLLQRSVAASPQPAAWHNLAVVHRYLGEKQLSALAEQESAAAAERMATKNHGAVSAQIRWVDPETFAASSRPATDVSNPVSPTAAELPTGQSPSWSQSTSSPRGDVKPAAATSPAFKPFWQRKEK
jgi:hypothetical protein